MNLTYYITNPETSYTHHTHIKYTHCPHLKPPGLPPDILQLTTVRVFYTDIGIGVLDCYTKINLFPRNNHVNSQSYTLVGPNTFTQDLGYCRKILFVSCLCVSFYSSSILLFPSLPSIRRCSVLYWISVVPSPFLLKGGFRKFLSLWN